MDHGKKKDNSNEANDKMLQNLQMLLALQGAGAGSQMYDPAMFGGETAYAFLFLVLP